MTGVSPAAAARGRWAWRRRWPVLLVLAVMLAAQGTILVAARRVVQAQTERDLREGRGDARDVAQIFREQISRTMIHVRTLHRLAGLAVMLRRQGDVLAADRLLAEIRGTASLQGTGVVQVSVTDPDGHIAWSSLPLPPGPPPSVATEDHVRAILADGQSEAIGAPTRGALSGVPVIPMSAAIVGRDGTLLGVSTVSIDPNILRVMERAMTLASTDVITLLRGDGLVLARTGGFGVGRMMDPQSGALGALGNRMSVIWRGPSGVDGVQRLIAMERMPDDDMIVVAGLNEAAHLAQTEPFLDLLKRLAMMAVVLMAALAGGLLLFLAWQRRVALERARGETVRESERLFRTLTESLPDMICLHDAEGRVLYASPSTRTLTGLAPEALVGKPPPFTLNGEGGDHMLTRADGSRLWVESGVGEVPVGALGNDAIRMVSTTRDVSRRRVAEEALQRAREDIDTVVSAAPAGLYRYEQTAGGPLRMQYISPNIETLTGFTAAEAMATPGWWRSRVDPAFADTLAQHMQRIAERGISSAQYRFRHRNGSFIWINDTCRRVDLHRASHWVGYFADITREKLQAEQLTHAGKLAFLGEMATGMAHELNQPLAGISMTAENALALVQSGTAEAPALAQKLNRIIEQAMRAAALIDHMRVFGRRDDGPPGAVNVADAVAGATLILEGRIARAGIALRTHIPPDLPPVRGHLVLLEQVLMNLLANAADAILAHDPVPGAARRISLSAQVDQDKLAIVVQDTGGGVPEDALTRLFEPFFTTKSAGHGTGLGLSISYGIITDMGGQITVRNEDGGAVFEILLPVDVSASSPEAVKERAAAE